MSDVIGCVEKVTEMVKPEDFYDVSNRMAYEICLSLYNAERAVDLVTFESEAKKRGVYDRIGGQPYLAEVVSDTVAVVHAVYYAEIVKEVALHRHVIEAGNKISGLGYKTELGGFQPGSLNTIAAHPSMRKTALALNIAQFGSNAKETGNILFFSLEMSSKQLIHRVLSAQTLELGEGVEVSSITSGTLSGEEAYALERAGSRRNENRQNEFAEISRMLKSTAVELNCPIIALSQLSRETERRTEKKPQLSDVRDSGSIEQDADTVIMLFREDYYGENENNDELDSKADIRVAKNRNGSTGMCHLLFRRNYTRFMNYGGDM